MHDFEIKVVHNNNKNIVGECLGIAKQNHLINGGTLRFMSIVQNSDYIICAVKDEKVLGYIGMVKDFIFKGDFYIYQLAIKKDEMQKGIATSLMNYVKSHSKGYVAITSNVRKDNIPSFRLHEKLGFVPYDTSREQFTFVLPTEHIVNNDKIKYTDEENELE